MSLLAPLLDRLSGRAMIDARRQAQFLYYLGFRLKEIAEWLNVPAPTVTSWKGRDRWDDKAPIDRVEAVLEANIIRLTMKEPKTGSDVRDLDLLCRQLERLARIRRYGQPGGHEGDLNAKVQARADKPKAKPSVNLITAEQAAELAAALEEDLFGYQEDWRASSSLRTRVILKSRQIGATWYFAREAVVKACETGNDQIFLSASKAQAHIFRRYIQAWVYAKIGVDLVGDPIVIQRGEGQEPVTLHFLGTNSRTAQGYHGDFYFDEFFWTFRFKELKKVASAMATHKRYRRTYFSTPSSINHEAYPFWTGDEGNKNRAKADKRKIDVSHANLKPGRLCDDSIWRQIVTVEDAAARGCDLFDIDELRAEYSPDEFDNLFLCQFVDDSQSVFPMAEMLTCAVESYDEWDDFDFHAHAVGRRPFGEQEVWVAYDPNDQGRDGAGLVVVAPPPVPGQGKFRVLERHRLHGLDFASQAAAIEAICRKYRVTKIDIDKSGCGSAVLQLVQVFFPAARGHQYSVDVKNRLVLKAKDTIKRGRLQLDAAMTDVMAAFMSIKRALTGSGRDLTYVAGRTEETGHAELAWATMMALDNEPLEAVTPGGGRRGSVEIFE